MWRATRPVLAYSNLAARGGTRVGLCQIGCSQGRRSAGRAGQRLALEQTPEVKVTTEIPKGILLDSSQGFGPQTACLVVAWNAPGLVLFPLRCEGDGLGENAKQGTRVEA